MGKTNFDVVQARSFIDNNGNEIGGEGSSGEAIVATTGSFSEAVTMAKTLAVTGAVTATGGVVGNVTGGIIGVDIATADATATASTETVDPDEFAAVVALVNACKAKLNTIIVASE